MTAPVKREPRTADVETKPALRRAFDFVDCSAKFGPLPAERECPTRGDRRFHPYRAGKDGRLKRARGTDWVARAEPELKFKPAQDIKPGGETKPDKAEASCCSSAAASCSSKTEPSA